jgi:pimeloyl-ACP methyl ester carboxylesterase
MGRVHANGVDLHVTRLRTGPPGDRPIVVCVHGLAVVDKAANSFVLGFHLARDAEVIAYDLRGHGRSELAPTGYRIADHAADLVGLLDTLGITQPVHLVAFSYGGAIATLAAMRYPERVASLTLLDGIVPVAGWETSLFGTVRQFEIWVDEGRAQGLDSDEIFEVIVGHVMEEFRVTRRRATAVGRRVHRLFEHTSLREDIRRETVFDKEDYAHLRCPVLAVYGDKSELYWLTDLLPSLLADVRVHTVAGADHLDVYWRVDEVRPLVRDFIVGVAAGSAAPGALSG